MGKGKQNLHTIVSSLVFPRGNKKECKFSFIKPSFPSLLLHLPSFSSLHFLHSFSCDESLPSNTPLLALCIHISFIQSMVTVSTWFEAAVNTVWTLYLLELIFNPLSLLCFFASYFLFHSFSSITMHFFTAVKFQSHPPFLWFLLVFLVLFFSYFSTSSVSLLEHSVWNRKSQLFCL